MNQMNREEIIKNKKNLRCANLRGADLSGANLRDANLRGADLRDVNLRGAALRYANLRDADLRDTDLRDTGLEIFQFERDVAYYCKGMLRIGCEYHKLDEWKKEYETIGKKYDYTDRQIERYGTWIMSLEESQ